MRFALACLVSWLLPAAAHCELSPAAFLRPPQEARPWVYWFWLSGNITSNGITADLESMQRVGIGGVLIMEVDQGVPKGPVSFLSKEWLGLFNHACSEAQRLGLQVNMNNDAGWCGSGGPWITPELSMQKVVWTERRVHGPAVFDGPLEKPTAQAGFYRDIAVLAFPTPEGDEVETYPVPIRYVTSEGQAIASLSALEPPGLVLPVPRAGKPVSVEMNYSEAFSAQQVILKLGLTGSQMCYGEVQVSDDATNFHTIRNFIAEAAPLSLNLPATKSRSYRFLFTRADPALAALSVLDLRILPQFRVEHIDAKAGFVRKYAFPGPDEFPGRAVYPEPAEGFLISESKMLDLTRSMDEQGKVRFEVPTGSWTILRIGHTSTGKDNHPAPETGRGLECDKLSVAGAQAAFTGLMGRLLGEGSPAISNALVSTHIDSWEVGCQNWTPEFRSDFQRLRGYDPLHYLPVITGRVVNTLKQSERFLWDLRKTISDLIVQNYAGTFQALARSNGIRLSIEAYDNNPCDDFAYAGRADEPMAEFWSVDPYGMGYSCTEMSSAAHVYGKPIVGAESFTAVDSERWLGHPFSIKVYGDWAFCEGVNRFVVHRYAMQPWTDPPRQPGMSMGPWGQHYERTQTWWELSTAWHEYLARCQSLLQQGLFVADICYLAPEHVPRRWRSPSNPAQRPGYNFDACPPEVLLDRMEVKDGRLVLPDGMSYRLLVLPEAETMTPELLTKLAALVRAGATVIGAPPSKSPSLSNFPDCDRQVAALAGALWAGLDGTNTTMRSVGKGRVFWGPTAQQVLVQDGVRPDFVATTPSKPWRHIHKKIGAQDVYFLAQPELNWESAVCEFRVAHGKPQLWHPDTGSVETPVVWARANGVVRIPIRLGPAGSVFVVFSPEEGTTSSTIASVKRDGRIVLDTKPPELSPRAAYQDATNSFTMAGWVKPDMDITLLRQTNFGTSAYRIIRNDAVYPPPGYQVFAGPNHAGAGLSIGRNGIMVIESSADYFPPVLVYTNALTNWTHVTVVYRQGQSELYVNGRFAQRGSKSVFLVHPGVGVDHRRGVAPFEGELGEFTSIPRELSEKEILDLARSTSVPKNRSPDPGIRVTEDANGILAEVTVAGNYEVQTREGVSRRFRVRNLAQPITITGPWKLQLEGNAEVGEQFALDTLMSWSEHPSPAVRHFSGAGIYETEFVLPSKFLVGSSAVYLDLGKVAVMAEVTVNGVVQATLWKPPFRVEIKDALKPGRNHLRLKVINLWPNRMVGDEALPEDSERNSDGTLKSWPEWLLEGKPSPSGRASFTTWRLWGKDSPLQPSGLLGPVRLYASRKLSVTSR